MDNIFFNASHSDRPPSDAFLRPKHTFKGIGTPAAPQDAQLDARAPQEARTPPVFGAGKLISQLPPPPGLHQATPHQARTALGLPMLPRDESQGPHPLRLPTQKAEPATGPSPVRPDAADAALFAPEA